MKRAIALFLVAAMPAAGAVRRAVTQPSPPKRMNWAITLTFSDLTAAISSSGSVTVKRGGLTCAASLAEAQRVELEQLVKRAEPARWPATREGAVLKLTRDAESFEASVIDSALPSDLSALYAGAASVRDANFNVCTTGAANGWAIEAYEEGGFIYRYHRVTADASGNVTVQPSSRGTVCTHLLDPVETAQFAELALAAQPLAWLPTYVRKENPSGCCDQIHTGLRLIRFSGVTSAMFATDWFSDHDPLPPDLTALYERLFGPLGTSLFERYGAACGPIWNADASSVN